MSAGKDGGGIRRARFALAGLPLALLAFVLTSCASGSGAVGSAVATTAVATAVGGANVANGQCFTVCPRGTTCNPQTKLCDTLPCHGDCPDGYRCDESSLIPKCVPDSSRIFIGGIGAADAGSSTATVTPPWAS